MPNAEKATIYVDNAVSTMAIDQVIGVILPSQSETILIAHKLALMTKQSGIFFLRVPSVLKT